METNAAPGRSAAMPQHHDANYNRDADQKVPRQPGRPQRSATEPKGSEGSARTSKTLTDPATGEPTADAHAPNQAQADQTDGVTPRKT